MYSWGKETIRLNTKIIVFIAELLLECVPLDASKASNEIEENFLFYTFSLTFQTRSRIHKLLDETKTYHNHYILTMYLMFSEHSWSQV